MNKLFILILQFVLSFGGFAKAETSLSSSISELSELSLGIERSLYFDTYFFSGFTMLEHANLVDKVQGATNGVGFSIGANIESLFILGLTTDYRWLSQSSEVDDTHPNFTGKRFVPLAPFVALSLDEYVFKLEYQTLGNLEVSKSVPEGGSLIFSDPMGFRFSAFFDHFLEKYPWGIYYESTAYKKKVLSDIGETTLTSKFSTWQIGAMISVVF